MTDDRIPTDVWVTAQVRALSARGMPVYVLYKGALAAGTVMVKVVVRGQGVQLFDQARDMDGKTGWMRIFDDGLVDEKKADEYIQRSRKRDPDLWVIEVEDSDGNNPFEGKIL